MDFFNRFPTTISCQPFVQYCSEFHRGPTLRRVHCRLERGHSQS